MFVHWTAGGCRFRGKINEHHSPQIRHDSLLGVIASAAGASGQLSADWDINPNQPVIPFLHGQWEGPYSLDVGMLQDGVVAEIAHAVYIADGAYAGQIMFWNWPNPDSGSYNPRSFLWDPDARDKTQVEVKLFPVDPVLASEDPFCSGHVTLANGDIFVAGGRDFSVPDVTGTKVILVFRQATGQWERLTHQGLPVELGIHRYYPSAVRWLDGDVVLLGHTGAGTLPPALDPAHQREHFRALTGLLDPIRFNWTRPPLPLYDCNDLDDLSVWDYAKTVMLSDGQIMWMDGEVRLSASDHRHASFFINLETEDCSGTPEPWRWRQGALTDHQADHAGGSAAHFVLPSGFGAYDDIIYSLGGTEHGEDDNSACSDPILDLVERFEYDGDGMPELVLWEDAAAGVIPLRKSRKNPNAVILLDGSVLVVGGLGPEPDPGGGFVCEGRLRPERLKTPEVFGASGDPQWRLMAPQQDVRPYHGVAIQLADGRVVSAGGAGAFGSSSHRRSVEIYRPPYFFKTPRPEITSTVPPSANHAEAIDLTVELSAGFSTSRVALLATGSVTHTFDWNQRYVELEFELLDSSAGPPLSEELRVAMPPTDRVAPPGFYFLTVVDEGDIPSPAALIRLGAP